jgi:NAD(P)-dependent dehydrogenase (short-subunit alcohol dehydrogenase family)
MKIRLKKLRDQVIVLTGASSGIGLVTARMAAHRGARLVLAARSGEELERLSQEIKSQGGQAVPVAADVSQEADVRRIAAAALEHFGRFDTWVNNAGVTVFGLIEEVTMEDHRRLFETNFWGTVYGSLAAVRHLRQHGGALINMGSVASDRAFSIEGMYSASKHAVKGFTDALRVELEKEGAPISVTLIKPTAIATPLPHHGANYLPDEPTLPPPVYAPELVARAILHCAEHPERDLFVGGAAKAMASAGTLAPRLMDRVEKAVMFREHHSGWPARPNRQGNLYQPSHELAERGSFPRHVFERSAYTSARMHPLLTGAAVLGAGLAVGGLWTLLHQGGSAGAGRAAPAGAGR